MQAFTVEAKAAKYGPTGKKYLEKLAHLYVRSQEPTSSHQL